MWATLHVSQCRHGVLIEWSWEMKGLSILNGDQKKMYHSGLPQCQLLTLTMLFLFRKRKNISALSCACAQSDRRRYLSSNITEILLCIPPSYWHQQLDTYSGQYMWGNCGGWVSCKRYNWSSLVGTGKNFCRITQSSVLVNPVIQRTNGHSVKSCHWNVLSPTWCRQQSGRLCPAHQWVNWPITVHSAPGTIQPKGQSWGRIKGTT